MCRGHPTGICDSSRSPSPSGRQSRGLRLTRGRLQCHVSGESSPRFASSVTAGKISWSLMISASFLIMSRRLCTVRVTLALNLVEVPWWLLCPRTRWDEQTLSRFWSLCFGSFTAEAVVHRRNHPCRDEDDNILDIGHSMQHGGPWT